MRKISITIISIFLVLQTSAQTTVYGFQIPAIETGTINLNNYQGKKILLVNSASQSNNVQQYAELQQLYIKFKDSGLVIITVPSNSFNTEPQSNAQILQTCINSYGISFPMAAKAAVKGTTAIALYQWLTKKAQNSVMDTEVKTDFQKYLINTQGKLVGVFAARIHPMHDILVKAIRNTQ